MSPDGHLSLFDRHLRLLYQVLVNNFDKKQMQRGIYKPRLEIAIFFIADQI